MTPPFTLVFVYNADSGIFNALADALHKLVSPETYACQLCALTYTYVGMRPRWRAFIAGLGVPVAFLHADELKRAYGPVEAALPAVFADAGGRLTLWLSREEIAACGSLEELEARVHERLARAAA